MPHNTPGDPSYLGVGGFYDAFGSALSLFGPNGWVAGRVEALEFPGQTEIRNGFSMVALPTYVKARWNR